MTAREEQFDALRDAVAAKLIDIVLPNVGGTKRFLELNQRGRDAWLRDADQVILTVAHGWGIANATTVDQIAQTHYEFICAENPDASMPAWATLNDEQRARSRGIAAAILMRVPALRVRP